MYDMKRVASRYGKITILTIICLIACVIWRHVVMSLLMTIGGAILLSFVLLPLVKRLERRMKPAAAAGLSMILLIMFVLMFLGLVFPLIVEQAAILVSQLPDMLDNINILAHKANDWLAGINAPQLPDISNALDGFDLSILVRGMVSAAGGVLDRLGRYLLIPMISFYLLRDRDMFCYTLEMLIPIKYRKRAVWTACETKRALLMYLRGHFMVSAIVGAASAVAFGLMGVSAWLALAIWVAVTDLVPYFGPFLGMIPIAVFAPVIGVTKAIWALVAIIVINQIESNFISPRVIGDHTGIHPVTVLVALLCGNMMFGILGLMLSLPVLIAVLTINRAIHSAKE